ncbi:MAG: enoyl-CoA hydratase/isomerase family protein [Thermodesulfobacteriota bacterium]|nr:enoyl-CoA hydratase/isomerase family protein [Thermodesulfobacteriota bacterium]
MAIMEWEKDDSVAVLRMTNGANRQNLAFADEMNRLFDEILADEEVSSMVLTSSDEKNFSQGIDVEWLGNKFNESDFDSIKSFMYGMNRVFTRILLMPLPVIAAINGHAFGNGAMLACACDFRFMKEDRGYFCFPEVDLSIPFLPGMIAFVRKAVPEYKFNEMKLTGRRVTASELQEHHIIEKASADIEGLLNDVLGFAKTFHKKRGIFGEHKKRMHKEIVKIIENDDPEFIDSLNLFVE